MIVWVQYYTSNCAKEVVSTIYIKRKWINHNFTDDQNFLLLIKTIENIAKTTNNFEQEQHKALINSLAKTSK